MYYMPNKLLATIREVVMVCTQIYLISSKAMCFYRILLAAEQSKDLITHTHCSKDNTANFINRIKQCASFILFT